MIDMAMLALILLLPTILAQGHGKGADPNDEPFLPIFPVYPYNPKLIKRGTDRDTITQLSPELYAPKLDAKDSYSSSYNTNYPRDPYYPTYNPYPKASTSSGYSYYGSLPYTYPSPAYSAYNSYSTPYPMPPSYSGIPYSGSYPNYYYQPPYYYPNYYSQPMYAPPPLPPAGSDYSGDSNSDQDSEKSSRKKPSSEKRYKNNNEEQESTSSQYVDGGNYISGNSKDLDSQPSTYKTSSPQNQLEQVTDIHIKGIQLPAPKTTYRVISVAGQPVGPDYPLPARYIKAQQLEDLMMSQTWAKMLAQNLQAMAQYPNDESKNSERGQRTNQNDQNKDSQRHVSVPNVIAKTGLAYVVNPNILGKLSIANAAGQISQTPTTHLKNIIYPPPIAGVYAAVEKPAKDQADSNEYENYESPSSSQGSQDYDSSASQNEKQQQNYEGEQSYQNQNFVTVQTPQGYSYQYTGSYPSQTSSQQQSQQQYKNNLDDVNFGTKTKKG